jgi:hypothetical protein
MDLREIGCESVDCIHLAHDRDKWRAVVNTLMNLHVLENYGNFLTRLLRSGLCLLDIVS